MEKIRLQKYISECGAASRRAAEAEIEKGNVTVNHIPAVLGQKIDPETDEVRLCGKRIVPEGDGSLLGSPADGERRHTYILLNKPVGYVTTLSDEKGRPSVKDLIANVGVRLYPVGRLDMYSDGLLLCTNDGALTNRLTHPSHDVAKVYRAVVLSRLSPEDVARLAEQIEIDGYRIRPVEVEFEKYATLGNNGAALDRDVATASLPAATASLPTATDHVATVVRFTLHEGRNRQIRRMCAYHGYRLAALTRIRIGKIELGELPRGKWRALTEDEIAYLKSI